MAEKLMRERSTAAKKKFVVKGGYGYTLGDVFQINEKHGRAGWLGAFVMATEIQVWGIRGFVSHVESHDKQVRAYVRIKWEELDYVGRAPLIPADELDGTGKVRES